MTNFPKVARSLGLKGCKTLLGGGFNAAYLAHKSVVSDSAARALRAACLEVVVASMAKAKAAATTPAAAVTLVNAEALVERLIAHLGACVRQSDTVPGCRKALGYVAPAAKGCAYIAQLEATGDVILAFHDVGYEDDGGAATKRLVGRLARICVRTGKAATEVVQDWIIRNDESKAAALLASLYDAAVRERAQQEADEAIAAELNAAFDAKYAKDAVVAAATTTTERTTPEEARAAKKAARKAVKWAAKAAAVAIKKGKATAITAAPVVEVVAEPVAEVKAAPSIMMAGFTIADAMFCLGIDHKAVAANMAKIETPVVVIGSSFDGAYMMQVAA